VAGFSHWGLCSRASVGMVAECAGGLGWLRFANKKMVGECETPPPHPQPSPPRGAGRRPGVLIFIHGRYGARNEGDVLQSVRRWPSQARP
jgi:hypothetical protein